MEFASMHIRIRVHVRRNCCHSKENFKEKMVGKLILIFSNLIYFLNFKMSEVSDNDTPCTIHIIIGFFTCIHLKINPKQQQFKWKCLPNNAEDAEKAKTKPFMINNLWKNVAWIEHFHRKLKRLPFHISGVRQHDFDLLFARLII